MKLIRSIKKYELYVFSISIIVKHFTLKITFVFKFSRLSFANNDTKEPLKNTKIINPTH